MYFNPHYLCLTYMLLVVHFLGCFITGRKPGNGRSKGTCNSGLLCLPNGICSGRHHKYWWHDRNPVPKYSSNNYSKTVIPIRLFSMFSSFRMSWWFWLQDWKESMRTWKMHGYVAPLVSFFSKKKAIWYLDVSCSWIYYNLHL